MKWFLWMLSLGLASLGGLLIIFSIALVSRPDVPQADLDVALGLFILAVPPLIISGAIGWGLYFQQRQARERSQAAAAEQLQQLFYQLVNRHQGRLTVMQFAAAANISGSEAKAYLDQRAKEFGADFTSEAAGEITYHFPL